MGNVDFEGASPFQRLGFASTFELVPPVDANTTFFEAGSVTLGLETRPLLSGEQLVRGPTVHIFDRSDGTERVRFDVLEDTPHYHYIDPGVSDRVVVHDSAASGPMWDWTMACLQARLPAVLRMAGADDLADDVDIDAVQAAIPKMIELVADSLPRGTSEAKST